MRYEDHKDGWPEGGYIWQRDEWPYIGYDATALQRLFEEVSGKAGELSGLRSSLSDDDQFDTYVREVSAETVHSFAIEGEPLDRGQMTDSVVASLLHRDRSAARGVYHNVAEVMLDARDTSRPMTIERMDRWHELLFRRDKALSEVGHLRTEPIRVVTERNFTVSAVHFHGIDEDRVQKEMQALMQWIAETGPKGNKNWQHATPGRAALGHLRFETIHPYADGNGRIGRALADFIAAENPIFERAPFSLSRVIEEDKKAYYDALGAAQKTKATSKGEIDVTPFVEWFSEAMARGLDLAAVEARHIIGRNQFFDRHAGILNDRQEKALRMVFEGGPERLQQGLSSKPYQKITGASIATATRDLRDLADKGVLRKLDAGGRSTAFEVVVSDRVDARAVAQRRPEPEASDTPNQLVDLLTLYEDDTRVERLMRQHGLEQPGDAARLEGDDLKDFREAFQRRLIEMGEDVELEDQRAVAREPTGLESPEPVRSPDNARPARKKPSNRAPRDDGPIM